MTSVPYPYEGIGLDEIPVRPPLHYAEQALLGALLLDPEQLTTVRTLLPEHFYDPMHAALYAAMRTVPAPDRDTHERKPVWLPELLAAALPEAPGLTPSYLHTLVQACLRSAHAAAYARIIRAEHARRTVRKHAERLAQTATEPTLPDPATAVLTQADSLARFLDELAGQFAPHPGSLPRTPLPPPPPRDTSEEALEEERQLLATATALPDRLTNMRWLRADDFVLPLHAAVFQSLTALARRGDPVDPVTVLWEAQHHSPPLQDVDPAELMCLVSTPTGAPEYWGEQVLHRALLAQAHTTALRIKAFTDDPANTPHQLITGSRRALADLTATRARRQRIRTSPPTTTVQGPRTPATPRAGSPQTTAPRAARISR
ncbi:DnaB-like helicase N-terminal domain-containing protein [Streptomyces sp. NPDC055025]